MKKRIKLIGIGTDGNRSLTQEAREQIRKSTVLIGAERMLQSVESIRKKEARCYTSYRPEEIMTILEQEKGEEISVLYSGDPGFYRRKTAYKAIGRKWMGDPGAAGYLISDLHGSTLSGAVGEGGIGQPSRNRTECGL